MNRFLAAVNKAPSEITTQDILSYVVHLKGRGLAPASVAQHVSVIKGFIRYNTPGRPPPTPGRDHKHESSSI